MDGHLRAYSTTDGKIIWDYDTVREFETVNDVKAQGGSLNNGGPTITGGMLYVKLGLFPPRGVIPGNVLLAFSAG